MRFAGYAFRGSVAELILAESALRGSGSRCGFRTVPAPWTIAAMSQESIRNYLASVESRLAADGCGPRWEDWAGAPVLVGRRADFRMRWAARIG